MDIRQITSATRPASAAWQRYHVRAAATQALVERLNKSGGSDFSWAEFRTTTDAFESEAELLRALQGFWHAALSARLDSALEYGEDLRADILAAYRRAEAELPGLHRFLDRHAGHPAIRTSIRAEHRDIAVAAGVASYDLPLDQAEARWRRLMTEAIRPPSHSVARRPSWLAMLRPEGI